MKHQNKNQNQKHKKINTHNTKNTHVPVLLREVLDVLDPKEGDSYLDLTAGYGGHASQMLEQTRSRAVLVDRDENAITELERTFGDRDDVEIIHGDFLQTCKDLVERGEKFDLILADVGVSSPHLDNASRGFSLAADGPLDMRMDPRQELDAATVVNTYSTDDLSHILKTYGEEPKAKKMAELIVAARPLTTTTELAVVAKKVWPGHSRTHPATRLFQAIRIEVNGELQQLEGTLPLLIDLLRPGGRVALITFHSLEDRITKQFFKEKAGDTYDAELTDLTPKPVVPTPQEIAINPRARSAKIRAAQRK